MHRYRLQAEFTFALHLHTVNTDVLLTKIVRVERIARNHAGFVEIKAAVAVIETEQGQNIEQINRLAVDGIFRPRRVCPPLRRHRKFIPTTNKFVDLIFHRRIRRQPQRDSVVLPGTDGVHCHARIGKTANIVKPQRGSAIADAPGRVCRRGQIRLRVHFFANFQQLPLVVQRLQKAAQIIKSHYSFSCEILSTARNPLQRRAL